MLGRKEILLRTLERPASLLASRRSPERAICHLPSLMYFLIPGIVSQGDRITEIDYCPLDPSGIIFQPELIEIDYCSLDTGNIQFVPEIIEIDYCPLASEVAFGN